MIEYATMIIQSRGQLIQSRSPQAQPISSRFCRALHRRLLTLTMQHTSTQAHKTLNDATEVVQQQRLHLQAERPEPWILVEPHMRQPHQAPREAVLPLQRHTVQVRHLLRRRRGRGIAGRSEGGNKRTVSCALYYPYPASGIFTTAYVQRVTCEYRWRGVEDRMETLP